MPTNAIVSSTFAQSRTISCALAVWGMLVFGVAFTLHYHYLLNTYYHYGASYNDGGILAQLVWRGDWKLTPPLMFTNYSFFGVHCIPLFVLLNALSYIIHVPLAEYYSLFLATVYASLGLVLFYLIHLCVTLRKSWHMAGAALLALMLPFHTIIMHGIWIGHFEYAIPLGIILFLVFYIQNRMRLAWLVFVFLLFVREDAGLHLTAILGLIGLLRFIEYRTWASIKREAIFLTFALAYAAMAMWISLAARSYYGSTFEQIYSGSPAFAHVSGAMLWDRLEIMSGEHIYLWAGLLLTMASAIHQRNIYLLVGFAAFIPWFLINLVAINPNTGVLYAYYAFPFLVATVWPLFGVVFRYGFPLPPLALKHALKLQVALLLLGLLMWNSTEHKLAFGPDFGARWGSYQLQKGAENRQEVRNFIAKFQNGAGNLGNVIGDNGILSLIKGGEYQGRQLLRMDTALQADTILYMRPYSQTAPEVWKQAKKQQLMAHYCMPDATICMFTRRSAAELGILLAFFEKAPSQMDK